MNGKMLWIEEMRLKLLSVLWLGRERDEKL